MNRHFARLCVVILLSGAVAGCAQVKADRPVPDAPTTVMGYTPAGLDEARAQRELLKADEQSRPCIEQALGAAYAAHGAYAQARMLLERPDLPEGVERPTDEQVDALRDESERKSDEFQAVLKALTDRYEAFFKTYPHNWYARHRFAWLLSDLNFRYEAARQWEKVIDMEPRFPYAYNNLGSLYNHMGRDEEAMDLFRKAIALKDDDPVFYTNLAANYTLYRKAASAKYGWDLPRTFEEAMTCYRKALALTPNDPEIARHIASQYVLARHFNVHDTADDAIDAWTYVLTLDMPPEKRMDACRAIGRIYLKQKQDPAIAREWLYKALEFAEDEGVRSLLKQVEEAERTAETREIEGE